MNWLIYVSGWFFGLMLSIKFLMGIGQHVQEDIYLAVIFWTMAWLWICQKFIR